MAENNLQIVLTAVDEASGPIRNAMNGIKQSAEDASKAASGAGKSIQEQFKEAKKDVESLRKSMFLASAAFGVIIASTREAAKYNQDAKKSYDAFATSISSLAAMVGTTLHPALQGVSLVVNVLRDTIEAAIAGFIKMFTLIIESFVAIWSGMQNIVANIKNLFTQNEDPLGIVEGFQKSFARAMEVSNLAADQFLNKVESTRAAVESGNTLQKQAEDIKTAEKAKQEAAKATQKSFEASIATVGRLGQAMAGAKEQNKGFARAAQAIAIGEATINTAVAITRARSSAPPPLNYILAAIEAAAGAIQIATIASQQFAVGTPSVPHDMIAQVHAGETIIPRTFAESIRRGDLTLGGPGAGSGNVGDININLYGVTIQSRESVREIAEELGFEIERQLRNARSIV